MNDKYSADKYYHKNKLFCEKNASLGNQEETENYKFMKTTAT